MALLRTIPTGDLAIENARFVLISGPEFVRQKLVARFKFFKGEWFLDLRQGAPHYRDVFGQVPTPQRLDIVRAMWSRIILSTPGVASVERLLLSFDGASRTVSFAFTARLKDGGVVVVEPGDRDFIVDLAA